MALSKKIKTKVLIVNRGSSSLKIAVYNGSQEVGTVTSKSPDTSLASLMKRMSADMSVDLLAGIDSCGIRVVAPGTFFTKDKFITSGYMTKLRQLAREQELFVADTIRDITYLKKIMPTAQLIALSDSVFHATIPSYARVYGIAPFLTRTHDLYRFGYHGISCASIIEKLSRGLFKGKKLPSRIIICHAGGGTSITAVRDGISVDTSMGYSPLSGVMMSTRSGDIDPAIVVQLMKKLNKSSTEVVALLAYASGSESFSSVKQARQIYLYQIQKFIGSYTAVLGGVDLIVFTGGRGEHDAVFRQEVCERLAGISVDSKKNEYGNEDRFIHDPLSHCSVAVVSTNEMAYMCSLINR